MRRVTHINGNDRSAPVMLTANIGTAKGLIIVSMSSPFDRTTLERPWIENHRKRLVEETVSHANVVIVIDGFRLHTARPFQMVESA